MEKSYQKQCQNYEAIDLAGTALAVSCSPGAIIDKVKPLLREFHSSLGRPFSRPGLSLPAPACSV